MTDILKLAREVGAGEPESLYGRTDYVVMTHGELERFATLIREQHTKELIGAGVEPSFHLKWKQGAYYVDKPNIGDTDCYTAEAIAATKLQAQLTNAQPVAWCIAYKGVPYTLWHEGDGPLLDLEVARQGGDCHKMALFSAGMGFTTGDTI